MDSLPHYYHHHLHQGVGYGIVCHFNVLCGLECNCIGFSCIPAHRLKLQHPESQSSAGDVAEDSTKTSSLSLPTDDVHVVRKAGSSAPGLERLKQENGDGNVHTDQKMEEKDKSSAAKISGVVGKKKENFTAKTGFKRVNSEEHAIHHFAF